MPPLPRSLHALLVPAVLAVVLLATRSSAAAGQAFSSLRLSASRTTVLNNGRDFAEILVEVRDSSGRFVGDGTPVVFSTNLGQFSESPTVGTRSGVARIRLSSPQKGTATVTAAVVGAVEKLEIVFTDDPSATFQGNAYMAVQANGSLLYSPISRVIEAVGRPRSDPEDGFAGAHFTYRNIEVFADRIQVDCTANVLRAHGQVHLRRGGRRLRCGRLRYELLTGNGYAIAEVENRLRPVQLSGADLTVTPLETGIAPKWFEDAALESDNLIITARQILLFPNEKLQFKRPRFYQDGQHLVSMPFYSLGLYSNELFTDQFMSVGTQGFGLDVPLYFNLTPSATGIFHIRHGERTGRSVFATRQGWSLDMTHAYSDLGSGSRYTGELGVMGINRADWGVRWSHSQELATDTRGSLFVDFPQHRSLFGSANLSKHFAGLNAGLNLTGSRSVRGFSNSGVSGDVYLETAPRKVGRTGYMYAIGGTAGMQRSKAGPYVYSAMTQGVQARVFSSPFRLDGKTTLTNYLTVGNLWTTQGNSGVSMLASLTANRTLGSGALTLTYDFARQPGAFDFGGSHRMSLNMYTGAGSKWRLSLYGNTMLDAPNASLIGDFVYAVAPRWRVSLAASISRFFGGTFRDYEVGLSRSLGGRELVLSYSTYHHRFFFDIEASRF